MEKNKTNFDGEFDMRFHGTLGSLQTMNEYLSILGDVVLRYMDDGEVSSQFASKIITLLEAIGDNANEIEENMNWCIDTHKGHPFTPNGKYIESNS